MQASRGIRIAVALSCLLPPAFASVPAAPAQAERRPAKPADQATSPDGKLVASGGNGTVTIVDVATQKEVRKFVGHKGKVKAVAFSVDGKVLASGGEDKVVAAWDVATGKMLYSVNFQDDLRALAFTPDGKRLIVQRGLDGSSILDSATGKVLEETK